MKRVAVIHPWFPQYRQAFFEEIVRLGKASDLTVDIFHGDPPPEWKERADSVSAPFALPLTTRFLRVGHRSLALKSLRPFRERGPYDLVVLEQAVRNLETYPLLLTHSPARVAFWGHGSTRTRKVSRAQEFIKQWLTRRGSWFFSYTDGGAVAVEAAGYDSARVTVVRNSIDTRELRVDLDALTDEEVADFKRRHDLLGPTGLFIGGLDDAKRIPFLLDAAREIRARDPRFRLLVAGAGVRVGMVAEAAREGYVVALGPLRGRAKALALASSSLILMPGRVGLIAVESLIAGVPLVTTDWPWHAPEFEYLTPGRNALVTEDDLESYVTGVHALLDNPTLLATYRSACLDDQDAYSTEYMARSFVSGLQSALGQDVVA